MQTVTISKKEYQELIEKKLRYEYLHQIIEKDIFSSKLTKDVKKIIKDFHLKYEERFSPFSRLSINFRL